MAARESGAVARAASSISTVVRWRSCVKSRRAMDRPCGRQGPRRWYTPRRPVGRRRSAPRRVARATAERHQARTDDVLVFESGAELRDARQARHFGARDDDRRGNANRPRGGRRVSTDWAVPYRRVREAITVARGLADDAGVEQAVIYGHAGGGHPPELHCTRRWSFRPASAWWKRRSRASSLLEDSRRRAWDWKAQTALGASALSDADWRDAHSERKPILSVCLPLETSYEFGSIVQFCLGRARWPDSTLCGTEGINALARRHAIRRSRSRSRNDPPSLRRRFRSIRCTGALALISRP